MNELQQLKSTEELEQLKDTALTPAMVKTEKLEKYRRKNRKWQGIPTIAITGKGVLYCACYSGGDGECADNYVLVERSVDDGETWSEPIAVVDPEGYVRAFDMCLWITPASELALFWAQSFGGFDGRAGVFLSICKNPEEKDLIWTKSVRITDGVMLNKPITGKNGEWLMALSLWNNVKSDFNKECGDRRIKLYATADGKPPFWRVGGFDMEGRYYDEPMVLLQRDGVLRMLVRLPEGIGEAFSDDGGKTWRDIQKTDIWGPNSRFYFGRLKSGRLLLINHRKVRADEICDGVPFQKRSHLSAWLSIDDGVTWSAPFLLDERVDVSYPDAAEDAEGNLYIIYDYSRYEKKQLILSKVSQEEIMKGRLERKESYLGRVIDQAGV